MALSADSKETKEKTVVAVSGLSYYMKSFMRIVETSTRDASEVFRKSPQFAQMNEAALVEIACLATACSFRKGDFIFREGNRCSFFHIVKQGRVKCFKQSATGKTFVAYVADMGDTLNGIVLLSGRPHFLSAQALDDVVLLRVKREDYLSVIDKDKDNLKQLVIVAEQAIGSAYDRIMDVVSEKAEQRIINILDMLYRKFGRTLNFSSEELGELAGTTRETTIRVLTRLKDSKVIQSGRREIYILNESELQDLSCCSDHSAGRI